MDTAPGRDGCRFPTWATKFSEMDMGNICQTFWATKVKCYIIVTTGKEISCTVVVNIIQLVAPLVVFRPRVSNNFGLLGVPKASHSNE